MMRLIALFAWSLVLNGCLTTDPGLEKRGTTRPQAQVPEERRGYYPINGQHHPVVYAIIDGKPMTGGDIMLDPEKLTSELPPPSELRKRGSTVHHTLWPSRFITLFINVEYIEENYAFWWKIYEAANQFNSNTNVQFNIVGEALPQEHTSGFRKEVET